jgi:hypothetical protein
MATNPIDPTIQYPDRWTPMEYLCNCGVRCRVDVKVILGPSAGGESVQHCKDDETHLIPGPIIAMWEEHGGQWMRTG